MPSHHWMQQLSVTAICPKCQAPALRRSHSTSTFEKYRKARTNKRIYRCHACSWRGWLFENELRFPPVSTIDIPAPEVEDPILIPSVTLEEIELKKPVRPPKEQPSHAPHAHRESRRDGHARAARPADARRDRPGATQDANAPEPTPFDADLELPGDVDFKEPAPATSMVPDFGVDGPTSHPVPDSYHSRHRHTGRKCPNCKSDALFRSHAKGLLEKLGKIFRRRQRLYRCHECNWRGWLSKR